MVISIGDGYEIIKSFSQKEVNEFARLSGDDNPIHIDSQYAKNTVFGQTIVHGALANAQFSKILGTKFPGEGTIYLEQSSKFIKPLFPENYYTFKVKVISVHPTKPIYTLETQCFDQKNEICIDGTAVVKYKE